MERILYLEININKYSPFEAGSSYLKLPESLEKRKAVVNVQNDDEYCFLWAVVAGLYPSKGATGKTSSYPHFSRVLQLEGLSFPLKLKDISKFEDMNNISVNVYGLEQKTKNGRPEIEVVGPLRYAQRKLGKHVNLLLISEDNGNCHYCCIKDMSRLLSSQLSKRKIKTYICDGCLQYFSNERQLMRHQCFDCNHVYTEIPTTEIIKNRLGENVPENILKFEHYERQMKVPFVVYADFESVLKPIDTTEPNPQKSYTNKTFKHLPYSFAYYIKCDYDDSLSKLVIYRGEDAAKEFVKRLEADVKTIYERHLKHVIPMKRLSKDEEEDFSNASVCNICNKPFVPGGGEKVRDHCHLTGIKRPGAAHSVCNLNYKIPNFIPVFLHNLKNYDCHLFIKQLASDKEKIGVIPQTKERYISFTKEIRTDKKSNEKGVKTDKFLKLRFLDSFGFMSSSLEQLADSLTLDQFKEMQKFYPSEKEFDLMRRKGVFPYSYVTDFSKLSDTSLPRKCDFYDNLTDSDISDEDYERAKLVWDTFKCQTLGDYSDVYLKSDVLILSDVFENFRNMCLQTYKLDAAQYYTAPGLSWDAMLKHTEVELELLTDIDMIHFLKKGIRGGISQCCERKHVANNQHLPNFNPSEPSSYIMYLDATNLYGHSMSQYLPYGGFRWLSEFELQSLDVTKVVDNSCDGYILEVDVDYPTHLHDLHSDLPFLVENVVPAGSKTSKLIPNLRKKRNYVAHYRTLKQALENGLILKKVHRVLAFKQSLWLKKYIDLNTFMRNRARNAFEKSYFKLMNNAVFGKTMENVDKRVDVKLSTHWERRGKTAGAGTLIARPNFHSASVFSENFVAIQLKRLKVRYDKPIYIGFSILDLSKTVLYDFFYGYVKNVYGNSASLLYTDTDSLILKVYTNNFYDDMKHHIDKFDTSNYSPTNIFNMPVTPSVLGKMKDEFPENPILGFYGTGAKAYYVDAINKKVKKAKGIKRSVIKATLGEQEYKEVVEGKKDILRKMNVFKSDMHDMFTEIRNKIALSCKDDKRFLIPNTTKTLAWGHKDILLYRRTPEQNLELFLEILNESDEEN